MTGRQGRNDTNRRKGKCVFNETQRRGYTARYSPCEGPITDRRNRAGLQNARTSMRRPSRSSLLHCSTRASCTHSSCPLGTRAAPRSALLRPAARKLRNLWDCNAGWRWVGKRSGGPGGFGSPTWKHVRDAFFRCMSFLIVVHDGA